MPKALSSLCLVLLICFGGSAWAGKPKIAILGLEAAPGPGGNLEPETTQVARDITRELRQRAQASTSPYVIAPNSNKELIDEKLLMSCDNEAASCMVVIGAGLAADVLLYGRVEHKGDAYRVSLKLLDVKAKTIETAAEELAAGSSATGVIKRLYNKLIGEAQGASVAGTLTVKARSQTGVTVRSGRVMIDEDRKGELSGGRLTVTGIAEGRHTIAIEASGYQRFEEIVTIRGGEQATLDALLLERSTQETSSSNNLTWKVSLGAGIAVMAAGGGFAAYSYFAKVNKQLEPTTLKIVGDTGATVSSDDCGKSEAMILANSNPKITSFNYGALQAACTWRTRTYIGYAIGGVGLLGAVVSLIMLTRDTDATEQPPTGARGKKSDLAIVPMLMPAGGGATLSMTW
jgi:PEGA domain-containing protein